MEPALQELYAEGTPDDEVAVILRLTNPVVFPVGVRIIARFGSIVTCRLRRSDIPIIHAADQVQSMKRARLYGPTPAPGDLTQSISTTHISPNGDFGEATIEQIPTDQRRPDGVIPTGRGVVVAHIDWGMDFAHPDFLEVDGKTRLLALWNQSCAADSKRPNRYGYGCIYEASDIDRALATPDPYATLGYNPADSDSGSGSHGTHTMSISAGNGRGGGPVGLAPSADLIFVHLSTYTAEGPTRLGDSVALLEAFDFIARMVGPRPFVVNCSLGRHAGQHDGKTLTEQGVDAFLRAAPGRAVIWSAGNYFDRSIHAMGALRPGESRVLRLMTDVADRTPNEVDLWYRGVDRFQITLSRPAGGRFKVQAGPGDELPVIVDGRKVGHLYHRLYDPNNGDNQVTLFLYRTAPAGEWELTLYGKDVADGRFHAWVERDAACRGCQARFMPDDSDPTSTTGTICNGFLTLAVGAYDAHQEEHPLAPFSSCGPTRDGRQGTPALVAPGVRVLAARSQPRLGVTDSSLLSRMSGTSMAAPHVTGTVALMFAAADRPLFIEETRRLLLAHTDPVSEDASSTERLRLGSGYLNTAAAVAAAEQAGRRPAAFVPPVSGETRANSNQKNQSERCELMSISSDPTAEPEGAEIGETAHTPGEELNYSDEEYEPIIESSGEATNYGPTEYEDAEATRDYRRRGRSFISPSPFQVQIPLTGGAPALAVPVGGYRSPLAFTVPLGGTPTATPLAPVQPSPPAPPPPSAPQTGGPVSPKPSSGTQTDWPTQPTPAGSAPTVMPVIEPVVPEPPEPEPPATEPPVTVASPDEPSYVPPAPGDMGTMATEYDGSSGEAKREGRAFSNSPFQVQIPLTGGGAGLAVPLGGAGSPLAFTVPLSGTSSAPVHVSSPIQPATTEPFLSEPLVTVATSDSPFYDPFPEARTDVEAMEQPEAWQEPDASECPPAEWGIPEEAAECSQNLEVESEPAESFSMSEAIPNFGEQVLAAAEAAAESDDTAPLSSAALLEILLGSSSCVESERESEAIPLSPLGRQGPAPSATTLFNAFVNPNHPLLPRNALHRHYARSFQVLAYPGQAMPDLDPRPGDLLLRVAQGQGWGHVAIVASRDLYRYDRLGDVGLRGEGYPRLRPGLYIQVVEVGPRRRCRVDQFARRLCDGTGTVLPDTLLLRPLAPGHWGDKQVETEARPRPERPSEAEALAKCDGAASREAEPVSVTDSMSRPTIRRGSSGPAVREAQGKLNAVHARQLAAGAPGLPACPLTEDGIFGNNTYTAVHAFQQLAFPSQPQEWEGIVGPKTWRQLDRFTVEPIPVPPIVREDKQLVYHPQLGYGWLMRDRMALSEFEAETYSDSMSYGLEEEILGTDDRQLSADTAAVPFRFICCLDLLFTNPTNASQTFLMRGSGTLISNRHVLTAAHNVLNNLPGVPGARIRATRIFAAPGRNGRVLPFGRSEATIMRVTPEWERASNAQFDFALLTLRDAIGATNQTLLGNRLLGFWGHPQRGGGTHIRPLAINVLRGQPVNLSGYPTDKCQDQPPNRAATAAEIAACTGTVPGQPQLMDIGSTQWRSFGNVVDPEPATEPRSITFDLDSATGHSGGPIWLRWEGFRNLVAVNTGGFPRPTPPFDIIANMGVRITDEVLRQLREWMRADGVTPTF